MLDDTMAGSYLYGGRIVNVASETVDNAVNLTLTGSTWTVTGTSYLNTLTIDSESKIDGLITVDGIEVAPDNIVAAKGGTITGNIVVTAR